MPHASAYPAQETWNVTAPLPSKLRLTGLLNTYRKIGGRGLASSCTLVCPVRRRFRHPLPLILFVLLCASAASVSQWSSPRRVTEDRNGDGRPDVWRTYDRQGRLVEVAVDTNFDGRSDVHEHYEGGALVRREVDRNFDDRVDLVQQFDYASHDQVRAVEDVDYDGTADLLVLFQEGHAVFSKWAHRATPAMATGSSAPNPEVAPRTADDPLTPFDDPFQDDLAVSAVRLVAGVSDCLGSSASGFLATTGLEVATRIASPSLVRPAGNRRLPSAIPDPHSPRGPPAARS
jgi:hypothetical protein